MGKQRLVSVLGVGSRANSILRISEFLTSQREFNFNHADRAQLAVMRGTPPVKTLYYEASKQ